jgi:hypothetical protein
VISLAHLTVLDAGPLELIDAALAGGFDTLGLRIVAPMLTDTIVPVIGDEPLIRESKKGWTRPGGGYSTSNRSG